MHEEVPKHTTSNLVEKGASHKYFRLDQWLSMLLLIEPGREAEVI